MLTPLPGTRLYEEHRDLVMQTDPQLFDFQHAVLPTLLGLEAFYTEFASLYATAYRRENLVTSYRAKQAWRTLQTSGPHALPLMIHAWKAVRRLSDPREYLMAHKAPYNRRETPADSP